MGSVYNEWVIGVGDCCNNGDIRTKSVRKVATPNWTLSCGVMKGVTDHC